MPHSTAPIYIHVVWITKYHRRILHPEAARRVEAHIRDYAVTKRIIIDEIAVQPEHVHCLIRLDPNRTLGEIVQLLKGESSHWINGVGLPSARFAWGRGYWAGSVDRFRVGVVRRYIQNQEGHHRKESFDTEITNALDELGITDQSELPGEE